MGMLESVIPTVVTPHRREYLYGRELQFVFAKFNPTSNGLSCWAEVRWIGNVPGPELLAAGRFDLMSSRTVPGLSRLAQATAKELGIADTGIPFARLLTSITYDVVRDHLEGSPTIHLADVKAPPTTWLLKPLIGGWGPTSFVGPGEAGKSFLALAAAMTICTGRTGFLGMKPQRTGPVMHLDWESGVNDQSRRAEAVCKPLGIEVPPNMLYRPMRGPLFGQAEQIAVACVQDGVVMVIVDSVMLARGSDAFSPEGTNLLYEALLEIGVPSLLIDHKSREAMRKGWKGAFGSVVNDNTTRLMWEFRPGADPPLVREGQPSTRQVKLVQTKRNNDRRREDLGFEWTITNDSRDEIEAVRYTPIDPHNVIAMVSAEDAPLSEQIVVALRRSGNLGMTVREISESLSKGDNTVRSRLSQLNKEGKAFKRVDRWFSAGMDDQRAVGDDLPDTY